MFPGLLFAVLVVIGIGFVYSGGVWLFVSGDSPLPRRRRERRIERIVRHECTDLDRRLRELIGQR